MSPAELTKILSERIANFKDSLLLIVKSCQHSPSSICDHFLFTAWL